MVVFVIPANTTEARTVRLALLLGAGASVDQANNDGDTSLYIASQNGHVEVVRALVEAGASVDQANNDGRTPLFMASQNGHVEVVKALLEAKVARAQLVKVVKQQ